MSASKYWASHMKLTFPYSSLHSSNSYSWGVAALLRWDIGSPVPREPTQWASYICHLSGPCRHFSAPFWIMNLIVVQSCYHSYSGYPSPTTWRSDSKGCHEGHPCVWPLPEFSTHCIILTFHSCHPEPSCPRMPHARSHTLLAFDAFPSLAHWAHSYFSS